MLLVAVTGSARGARTGVGAAGVLSASGFSQAFRGEPGVGASSAGQDRGRVWEGRGLLAGLPEGLPEGL